VWCAWQVTYRCNFRCKICSYWSQVHTAAEELTAEFDAGRQPRAVRSMLINLAGGEPLLRPTCGGRGGAGPPGIFRSSPPSGWAVTAERPGELWQAGMWGQAVSIDYATRAR